MLEPPTTCLTCETENQMMNVKSLTPGGCRPKELRRSSQYTEYWKIHGGRKVESKRLWNERRCYRDRESMARQWLLARRAWHYGGVGTQELGESFWLGGGNVESQVGGTQESGESPWFGGRLDGIDKGSPRVIGSLSV